MELELLRVILEEDDMKKELCDEFINQLENLSKTVSREDFIKDRFGTHSKAHVLEYYVLQARRLTKYGEYTIVLEDLLSNLDEVSITLDERTIDIARQAFGEKITEEIELLLKSLGGKS